MQVGSREAELSRHMWQGSRGEARVETGSGSEHAAESPQTPAARPHVSRSNGQHAQRRRASATGADVKPLARFPACWLACRSAPHEGRWLPSRGAPS